MYKVIFVILREQKIGLYRYIEIGGFLGEKVIIDRSCLSYIGTFNFILVWEVLT